MSQGVECYSCLPKTAWPSDLKRREKADCRTVDLVSGLSLTLCGSDELREIEVDV